MTSLNRGVLALGASLVDLSISATKGGEAFLMLGRDSNRPVTFRIGGQIRDIAVVNCRMSPRARWSDHLAWILLACWLYRFIPLKALRRSLSRTTPWIAALERADIVGDVRGGDSFSDIYGMERFLIGFLMAWTVLLVKGSMVQFPQTFGPYKDPLARRLAGYLLKKSSVVIARDEKSRQVAQSLLGPERKVWLSPDVAFSLQAIRPDRLELDPPLGDELPKDVVGLNVNGLMANGGYTRSNMFGLKLDYRSMLPELVQALLSVHRGELWLVPHTYGPPDNVESDPEACRRLRQALPETLRGRVRIVTGEYDPHEIKGVIGHCSFFIGSRMHACIAALSQGIPCVGIAYSMKFEGVFESVGMRGWVVDGRESTNEETVGRILELYAKRNMVRDDLAKNAAKAREELQQVFRRLISTAGKTERAGCYCGM